MTLQVRERELYQQIEEANQRAEGEREAQQQIQVVMAEAEVRNNYVTCTLIQMLHVKLSLTRQTTPSFFNVA